MMSFNLLPDPKGKLKALSPILFLMGMDSFNNLDKWYEWQAITQLCHIVVYHRPGQTCNPNKALKSYVSNAHTEAPQQLAAHNFGKLYFLSGETLDAASSTIREQLKKTNKNNELLDLLLKLIFKKNTPLPLSRGELALRIKSAL